MKKGGMLGITYPWFASLVVPGYSHSTLIFMEFMGIDG